MRLPRRAPREVYRLYSEEEYLAGATWEQGTEPVAAARGLTDVRRHRAFSATILLGAASAVGALVALNSLHQSSSSGRRGDGGIRSARAKRIADATDPGRVAPIAQTREHAETPPRVRRSQATNKTHQRRRSSRTFHLRENRFAGTPVASVAQRTGPAEFGFER